MTRFASRATLAALRAWAHWRMQPAALFSAALVLIRIVKKNGKWFLRTALRYNDSGGSLHLLSGYEWCMKCNRDHFRLNWIRNIFGTHACPSTTEYTFRDEVDIHWKNHQDFDWNEFIARRFELIWTWTRMKLILNWASLIWNGVVSQGLHWLFSSRDWPPHM